MRQRTLGFRSALDRHGARRHGKALLVRMTFGAGLVAAPALGVPLRADPLVGVAPPAGGGWVAYSVQVRGLRDAAPRTVQITTDGASVSFSAPLQTDGRGDADVELYTHDQSGRAASVTIRNASGGVVLKEELPQFRAEGPMLLHLGSLGGLDGALYNARVAVNSGHGWTPPEGLPLLVGAIRRAASGEPLLPSFAAGYAGVTVAMVRSGSLAALSDGQARALDDWVLAGGSLAVTLGRVEDLASPRVVAFAGGAVLTAMSPDTARFTRFTVPSGANAVNAATTAERQVAPAEETVSRLRGFTGPTLTGTRYGAVAPHGLGRVHFLAFDPTADADQNDPWVRSSTVDLVREAWEGKSRVAMVGNSTNFDVPGFDPARRLLDPNEGSRWSVGIAALLLVLYAIVAGPLTFRRANRRNDPLRALLELPLWSLGTLALIVGLGAVAKGGRARGRRLTLIEAAAGADRAAAVRFRAFFASSADALRVQSTTDGALLDVMNLGSDITRTVALGKGRAALERLRGRPWETVVVREDATTELGGSVKLAGTGTELVVENALGKDLVAVVVHSPGQDLRYFPRIPRGTRAPFTEGQRLSSTGTTPLQPAAPPSLHRLEAFRFAAQMNATSPGAGDTWTALEPSFGDANDQWPDSSSALLAEIAAGDGSTSDSGLALESNRVFLRVVGSEVPK